MKTLPFLAALFAGVLVGLLFADHQQLARLASVLPDSLADRFLDTDTVPIDPATAISLLDQIDEQLWDSFDRVQEGWDPDLQELAGLVDRAQSVRDIAELEPHEQAFRRVHTAFIATQIDSTHRTEFEAAVSEMDQQWPGTEMAGQAELLLFFMQHDFSRPIHDAMREDLLAFLTRYQDQHVGLDLFQNSSQEYNNRGQSESAEQIILWGLELFKDQAHRATLINELVVQGHRPAPKSNLTPTMLRAIEKGYRSALGSGKSCGRSGKAGGGFT